MSDEAAALRALTIRTGAAHSVGGVPPRNPRFWGRRQLLTALDRRVSQAPWGTTVLVGPFGVGKSHIAAEWVHVNAARFESVHWIKVTDGVLVHGNPAWEGALRGGEKPSLVVVDGLRGCDYDQFQQGGRAGHVLITSSGTAAEWAGWAEVVSVGPWDRQEAVDYLQRNIGSLGSEDAGRMAAVLGDLPLALAYAEAWLKRGRTVDGFLNALRAHPRIVLGGGGPDHYPGSLVARIEEVRASLAGTDRWLARLLDAAALLGPTPLPARSLGSRSLYRPADDTLSTEIALYPTELNRAFPVMGKCGLSSFVDALLHVSPVYCATVRGLLSPEEMSHAARWADVLLMALDPRDPVTNRCPAPMRWQPVLPSFLAREPQEVVTCEALTALAAAYDHMSDLGRWQAVLERVEALYRRGRELFSEDDEAVLGVGDVLLRAYTSAHRYADAVKLGAALRERRVSVCGPMAIDTLKSTSAMIVPLGSRGDVADAIALAQKTLQAQTSRLGADHRDTLLTKSRRAVVERLAGRRRDAVATGEAVLEEQQQVLGPTHPDVLSTAYELACAYHESGVRTKEALDLFVETLRLQRRGLGDEHPATVRTALGLELVHFEVYGTLQSVERCRVALERLRQEFGVGDRDVYRLEQIFQSLGMCW
ncbi:tetratricopeptide repeat protein [Streptomyces sp. NPDC005898]|uniref:tetratricopeptide repeat protein n=1 Tax=Streptomyces sp. NPDC005898 TaxID=3157082 RepID=UPI0033FB4DCC